MLQPTELPGQGHAVSYTDAPKATRRAAGAQQPLAECNEKPEKPRVKHGRRKRLRRPVKQRVPLAAPQDGPAGEEEGARTTVSFWRCAPAGGPWLLAPALPHASSSPQNQNRDLAADLACSVPPSFRLPCCPPGLEHPEVSQEAERGPAGAEHTPHCRLCPGEPRPPHQGPLK